MGLLQGRRAETAAGEVGPVQIRAVEVSFREVRPAQIGPGGRGLDFDSDGDFIASGAIGQNDNYENLWIGYLNCNTTGVWGIRNAGDDDRAGSWLDLKISLTSSR